MGKGKRGIFLREGRETDTEFRGMEKRIAWWK